MPLFFTGRGLTDLLTPCYPPLPRIEISQSSRATNPRTNRKTDPPEPPLAKTRFSKPLDEQQRTHQSLSPISAYSPRSAKSRSSHPRFRQRSKRERGSHPLTFSSPRPKVAGATRWQLKRRWISSQSSGNPTAKTTKAYLAYLAGHKPNSLFLPTPRTPSH